MGYLWLLKYWKVVLMGILLSASIFFYNLNERKSERINELKAEIERTDEKIYDGNQKMMLIAEENKNLTEQLKNFENMMNELRNDYKDDLKHYEDLKNFKSDKKGTPNERSKKILDDYNDIFQSYK